MSGFDYVVFLVVGLAAVAGFFRGFVEEVLSLAALCLAMLAVHYGHEPLTALLTAHLGSETGAGILAFALLLALPWFITRFLARRIGDASRGSLLGPIDRVLGFGFGAVKGFVVMVLAFSLMVFAYDVVWGPKGRPAWLKDGRTYPFLNAAGDELLTLISARRDEALKADQADDTGDTAAPTDTPADTRRPAHHPRRHHRPAA